MPVAEQQSRQFGDFVIDPAHNTVTSTSGSQQVPARVMDVLCYLIEHRDRVVPTEELLSTFWSDRIVEESTIHRIVSQIRSTLGDSARDSRYIRTISKRGYQAIAPLNPVIASAEAMPSEPSTAHTGTGESRASHRKWIALGTCALVVSAIAAVTLLSSDYPANNNLPNAELDAARRAEIARLNTVAILPFINLSADPQLGFFAVGLADTILDELVKQDLHVAARTSTFQAASRMTDLATIARQLKVSYVVEGSVQLSDNTVRVITQLIRASDGYHVWSKTYDELRTEGFDTQSLIAANAARLVGTMIRNDTMREHPELFSIFRGIDPQAIEHYLEAQTQYELFALGEGGDWGYSVQLFRHAAAADPDFAAAHREIAWANMQRLGGRLSLVEASREAHSAIKKALAIDPESSDTLLQLAQIYLNLDLDYTSARTVIRSGLELHPQGRWWYPLLADIAFREGRPADGLRLLDTASVIDFGEEQVIFLQMHAARLISAREYEAALEITNEALQLTTGGDQRAAVLRQQAWALIQMEQPDQARSRIAEAWKISGLKQPENFAHLFAATGETDRARMLLSEAEVQAGNAFPVALGYLRLGDFNNALKCLEYALVEHNADVIMTLRTGSFWDDLRDEPRFQALLGQLKAEETRARD